MHTAVLSDGFASGLTLGLPPCDARGFFCYKVVSRRRFAHLTMASASLFDLQSNATVFVPCILTQYAGLGEALKNDPSFPFLTTISTLGAACWSITLSPLISISLIVMRSLSRMTSAWRFSPFLKKLALILHLTDLPFPLFQTGNTPALAGSMLMRLRPNCPTWEHPRACGEHARLLSFAPA